jgi:serine/threonine-protein kinase
VLEIPGYSIQRILGHGGMATVYLAVQESLGRDVALKVLLPSLASDPVAPERFLREARFAAQLHHPNIVAIHEVGMHEGTPYMAMGYEPGGTMAGPPAGGIDPRTALRAVRDIALALEYAHRQGVVHRDIKPENILRRVDGTCVLSDFGIAHALAAQSGLTNEGTSVGTPHYMSPEQLRGEKVDGRADVYSLGVVLYQMLTGALPYQGTDGWAIGMQHLSAPVPRLPGNLAWLQSLVDDLLAKAPEDRVQSGAALVERVDALLAGPRTGFDTGRILLQPARRVHWLIAAPIALMVVASLMFVQHAERKRADARATAAAAAAAGHGAVESGHTASIAVLPFVDMSEGKDQEWFSDGLSEELINGLTQEPGLRVAGRTSSFGYKGRNIDLKRIGRELGVQSLLEGSVRKAGDRIRVTVQLVNAADGFHLWSKTFDDRPLSDVYGLQDEITAAVRDALTLKLLGGEAGGATGAQAGAATHRASPAIYTEYLRAQQTRARGTAESANARAEAFRKVTALDPKYAAAFAQLAMAESWSADYATDAASVAAAQRQALSDADRAVALDPGLADAYWARGNLRANLTWDWQGARADFEKAVALNPGDSRVLQGYGSLLASLGQMPQAIATTREAAERDPMVFSLWQALGYYEEGAGRFDEARVAQQRALALRPDFPFVQYRLGMLELQQRQPRRALAIFDAIEFEPLRLLGQAMAQHDMRHSSESEAALEALVKAYGYNAAYQVAQAYAWRGQSDMAFKWLDRAFVQRDGGLAEVKYDPALRKLRADPRFGVLLKKLGLPA